MLFSHAADVMQATAYFLERENVRSLLDPVDEVRHKQILEKISLENIARRSVWSVRSSTTSTTLAVTQPFSATRGASWRSCTTTPLSSRTTTLPLASSSPTPTTGWTSSRSSTLRRTRCSGRVWSTWSWPRTCRSTLCTWTSFAPPSVGSTTQRQLSTRGLSWPQRGRRFRRSSAGGLASKRLLESCTSTLQDADKVRRCLQPGSTPGALQSLGGEDRRGVLRADWRREGTGELIFIWSLVVVRMSKWLHAEPFPIILTLTIVPYPKVKTEYSTGPASCDAPVWPVNVLHPKISNRLLRLLHPWHVWGLERWDLPSSISGHLQRCRFCRVCKLPWAYWEHWGELPALEKATLRGGEVGKDFDCILSWFLSRSQAEADKGDSEVLDPENPETSAEVSEDTT